MTTYRYEIQGGLAGPAGSFGSAQWVRPMDGAVKTPARVEVLDVDGVPTRVAHDAVPFHTAEDAWATAMDRFYKYGESRIAWGMRVVEVESGAVVRQLGLKLVSRVEAIGRWGGTVECEVVGTFTSADLLNVAGAALGEYVPNCAFRYVSVKTEAGAYARAYGDVVEDGQYRVQLSRDVPLNQLRTKRALPLNPVS